MVRAGSLDPENGNGMILALAAKSNRSFAANDLKAMICHEDKHICSGERRTLVTFDFQTFLQRNFDL